MSQTGPDAPQRPRIIIENSEYWLSNIGDLAMMDVTIRRLRERWPHARIGVLTNTPLLMRAYFPEAEPIEPRGSRAWADPSLLECLCERAGPRLVGPIAICWVTARAWLPQKARGLRRRLRRVVTSTAGLRHLAPTSAPVKPVPTAPAPVEQLLPANTVTASRTAALVLVLGGGYLTDADPAQAARVLNLLEHAHDLQIPSALLGQGLGPMEDPQLLSRVASTLPHVGFIGLREARRGPGILARAGVPGALVDVTGDDAIELSYALRREAFGADIGVCLRVAGYSPVPPRVPRSIASTLQTVARDLKVGLVPLVIAEYKSQDRRSTLPLVRGYELARRPLPRFSRPQDVAQQIGLCRVVVTGAYHAAVFALAQGIPVVALTSSTYYEDKFLGLGGMFEGGLEVVELHHEGLGDRLGSAIRSAWADAPLVRPALRDRAEQQIAASQDGLKRVCDLI